MLEMPVKRFTLWNVIGGIAWPLAIVLAGYYAGLKLHIEKYALPVVGFVVIVSILSMLVELRRNKRRQAFRAWSRAAGSRQGSREWCSGSGGSNTGE